MRKTNQRNNNTYLIEGNPGDNPKLMGMIREDGRDSLYLEFYDGYEETVSRNGKPYKKILRHTERLNLYLWRAPRTTEERQLNKQTMEIAKRARFERGQELLQDAEGYRLRRNREQNFHAWYDGYVARYTKGDKSKIERVHEVFREYLTEHYPQYAEKVRPALLNKEMMAGFVDYLNSRFNGETPITMWKRFKKVVKAAHEAGVMRVNPCRGVTLKYDSYKLTKEVLSLDEVRQLLATPYPGTNDDVRRAFIVSLYCGVRWCDVKDLTYGNIDYAAKRLRFEQNKTKGRSSASGVVIPLTDGLLDVIGRGGKAEKIFTLPRCSYCNVCLQRWVDAAGIDKHITWHCARHSFATNILSQGANIRTVADLLGHSGLQFTTRYVRVVDDLKLAAIKSLPELE